MTKSDITNKYPGFFEDCEIGCFCGWLELIDRTVEKVLSVDPSAKAKQIKEKFGRLRIYASCNKEAYQIILDAEDESQYICEACGTGDSVRLQPGHWLKHYCDDCQNKRYTKGFLESVS